MSRPADPSSAAQQPDPVAVELPITLGQFLKVAGAAGTGGEAKYLVIAGAVRVNGAVETHRGRSLQPGDLVDVDNMVSSLLVAASGHPEDPPTP